MTRPTPEPRPSPRLAPLTRPVSNSTTAEPELPPRVEQSWETWSSPVPTAVPRPLSSGVPQKLNLLAFSDFARGTVTTPAFLT